MRSVPHHLSAALGERREIKKDRDSRWTELDSADSTEIGSNHAFPRMLWIISLAEELRSDSNRETPSSIPLRRWLTSS